MIFRFFRIVVSSSLIYLFLRVGYPEPGHSVYHLLAVIGILGASAILTFALTLASFASYRLPMMIEVLFAGLVLIVLGFTMPAKKAPPLTRLLSGDFPDQSSVEDGLELMGVNPKSEAGRKVIGFFPK